MNASITLSEVRNSGREKGGRVGDGKQKVAHKSFSNLPVKLLQIISNTFTQARSSGKLDF